jgi:hypothetical protein
MIADNGLAFAAELRQEQSLWLDIAASFGANKLYMAANWARKGA